MLWDAAWDQQNVIEGRLYSDHIADVMSGGGPEATQSPTTPGTGAETTPGGSTQGGSTPTTSPSTPTTPGGGGGADGMLIFYSNIGGVFMCYNSFCSRKIQPSSAVLS